MADVAESGTYTDAAMAISQGKRHLLVQDYTAAVTALAEGLEMMSKKHNDCDDELGEPYLLYGRALLGLAREEVGVLGGGVPGSDEADDDEEEIDDDDADEDKMSETEEKDEEMDTNESEEKKDTIENEKNEMKVEETNKTDDNEKNAATSNKTDDKKIEEKKVDSTNDDDNSRTKDHESVAGTSKETRENGTKSQNGKAEKSNDEDEDVNKDDDEEDPGRGIDLQVAWEVLELAKIVFLKRGEAGHKHLAETHRLLGEVAMESDNPQGAIADLEGSLKLLEKLEPCEPRAIAEIHYQLGLAHSLANDFDASIKQFGEATNLLEARIKQLEDSREHSVKNDDPFYTPEGEVKELKELLPAIQDKITDMKDFKEEACRLVIEGIKNTVAAGGCTNGAGTSTDSGQSSSAGQSNVTTIVTKPTSDISHLVRKKRKNEENEGTAQSPCKKTMP